MRSIVPNFPPICFTLRESLSVSPDHTDCRSIACVYRIIFPISCPLYRHSLVSSSVLVSWQIDVHAKWFLFRCSHLQYSVCTHTCNRCRTHKWICSCVSYATIYSNMYSRYLSKRLKSDGKSLSSNGKLYKIAYQARFYWEIRHKWLYIFCRVCGTKNVLRRFDLSERVLSLYTQSRVHTCVLFLFHFSPCQRTVCMCSAVFVLIWYVKDARGKCVTFLFVAPNEMKTM